MTTNPNNQFRFEAKSPQAEREFEEHQVKEAGWIPSYLTLGVYDSGLAWHNDDGTVSMIFDCSITTVLDEGYFDLYFREA